MEIVTICPYCGSDQIVFIARINRYNCINTDCGRSFCSTVQERKSLRIFISYGHDEFACFAEHLKKDLIQRGHEVWFDNERLKEGSDWEGYIEDGLSWAGRETLTGRVVFIMTPHSARRPDGYCLNEIAKALRKSLPIIPIMLAFCEPPLSIYRLQYLDMQGCFPPEEKPGSYAKQLERLTVALEDHKLDFEGMQSRLLKTLEPISFSADISELLQDFTGRQWVFDAVDSWLHDPDGSKVFWLTGAPGVGKSAISAWLRDNRREIVAFHFCDIDSEEKRNPSKLVRSLSYQISTQLPAYEERLKNLPLEEILQEYHEAYTLFDKLIVQPMADNFPPPDRTIVILIDGLDEATSQKRNDIGLFLSRCANKTPKWLRFLVTSRPEPEIRAALQSLSPYLLDASTDENRADIVAYLRKKLSPINDTQIVALLEKSEGLFLYVRHVCKEVKLGNLSLDRIDQFPQGLGDIYFHFFERQFGKNHNYFSREIRPLLCVILASFEPLQLGFLTQVFGYANRMELFDRLDRLGSLFPLTGRKDEDTITPFHRSLSDWLTEKDYSGSFYLDSEYGHRLLADYGWGAYLQGPEKMNDYSLNWLPSHLEKAGDLERFIRVVRNFDYLIAKTKAGMLERLLTDFRETVSQLSEPYRTALRIEEAFFRERAHILRRGVNEWPAYKILLQLALEHADDSPVTIGAEQFLAESKCDWVWLRQERRPDKVTIDPCLAVLEGHSYSVKGAMLLPGGRILSWSPDKTLRIWSCDGELLKTLEGHTGSVKGAMLLPGGRILSWGYDKTLRIWSCDGELLKSLEGHNDEVNGAMLLPDGHILSWARDKTLRIWSCDGELLKTLEGHTSSVNGAMLIPDGQILSWGDWGDDNTLRIWSCDGELLKTLEGHSYSANGAMFLPDGCILSWARDKTLRIWSCDGELLKTLEGHTDSVNGAMLIPDGHILSWARDKALRIWSCEGELLKSLEGHNDEVNGAMLLPDGRILSWARDKTLRIWSYDGELLKILEGHSCSVNGAMLIPDGHILSWGDDNTLRIWSCGGEPLKTLEGHSYSVNGAMLIPDGHILSWAKDSTLRIWNRDGEPLKTLEKHTGSANGAMFLPDGCILSWARDKTLRIWSCDGELLKTLEGHTGSVKGAMLLPGGRILSWGYDKTLRIWSCDGELLKSLEGHNDEVNGAMLLPDGRILSWAKDKKFALWLNLKQYPYRQKLACERKFACANDNALKIWSCDGELLRSLEGYTHTPVTGYSVDGATSLFDGRILSWAHNNTFRIWSCEGELLKTFNEHDKERPENRIRGVALLPNGQILSWARDKTLRIWSCDGELLKFLEGHNNKVNGAMLLPDGQILSWGDDKTLRIWSCDGELLKTLEGHTGSVFGAKLLPDGHILSWASDKTSRIWSCDGVALAVYEKEGINKGKVILQTYFSKNSQTNEVAMLTYQGESIRIIATGDESPVWQSKYICVALHLLSNGLAIVSQEDGQVCFLRIYRGNRRITLDELKPTLP